MKTFLLNGEETDLPVASEEKFEVLMISLQNLLNSSSECISSLKVNGVEMTESDESLLSKLPIDEIKRLEVKTLHPSELAHDTLSTLIGFAENLIVLSGKIAGDDKSTIQDQDFLKLIDSIQILADSVTTVKRTLRITWLQNVDVLEADLLSITKDLLDGCHRGQNDFVRSLLKKDLPKNLTDWVQDGIPSLMHARDS